MNEIMAKIYWRSIQRGTRTIEGVPPELKEAVLKLAVNPVLDVGPDGNFTRESLLRLTEAELLELAEDMGVDISECRTHAEMANALAAVNAEEALKRQDAGEDPGPAVREEDAG